MKRQKRRLIQRALIFSMAVLNTPLFILSLIGAVFFASIGDGIPDPASWLGVAALFIIAAPLFWTFPLLLYATWLMGRRDMWLSRPTAASSTPPRAALISWLRFWHVFTLYIPMTIVALMLLAPSNLLDSDSKNELITGLFAGSWALQLPIFAAWSAVWVWQKFKEELNDNTQLEHCV